MAHIHDLIKRVRASNPALGEEIAREVEVLAQRRAFGLNFERHTPEAVELPGRRVRVGDKVRILPPRGDVKAVADKRVWRVDALSGDKTEARLVIEQSEGEYAKVPIDDLVVVAEFRDPIYPGLVSTGKVERGGDKPFHSVINAENYHALQALLYTHRGKVDAIYIDPPYNTGARDWKYNDDYVESDDYYRHSKWLSMMESRLELAKELLAESGFILVSIDDREHARLRLLLDRVFHPENFIATFVWRTDGNLDNQAIVKTNQEYVLAYGRDAGHTFIAGVKDPNTEADSKLFNSEIRNSVVKNGPKNPVSEIVLEPGFPATVQNAVIPARNDKWPRFAEDLVISDGSLKNRVAVESGWAGANLLKTYVKNGYVPVVDTKGQETWFEISHTGTIEGVKRRRLDQHHILTVLMNMGTVETAGNQLRALGVEFPYPKPLPLIEYLLSFGPQDGIFLDFFAGSGTSTHAVMRLNELDSGQRRSLAITHNEVSSATAQRLRDRGSRAGDVEWVRAGIYESVTKPRLSAAASASDGFEENVEFFTLTYESPMRVQSHREFAKVAPLLWLRAGSRGRRIEALPNGWDVAETYGVIEDIDKTEEFLEAMEANPDAKLAFIVTDEDRFFEAIANALPGEVEVVRLYDSYLRNFEIDAMRGVR